MEMIIIFLLQSLFFLGLGLIIYTQKAADLLNFFNPKNITRKRLVNVLDVFSSYLV